MALTRREFIELLGFAGVSAVTSSWLVDRVVSLAAEGELPLAPGPGIESWVPTACGFCQGGCALNIRRIDGIPVGVRGLVGHPVNDGRLCSLPHAAVQMLFSPDRVRRPMKRAGRRGQGLWTEIGWDEAETLIASELRKLIRAGARERIAFLDGRQTGLGRTVANGFMRGIGSPHYIAPMEPRADELARRMLGSEVAPAVDLERSRVVMLFRFDYLETDGSPVYQSRVHALGRDRTIDRPVYISVGQRLFGSASKSDYWLPARPGTEGIVAAAIAHVILENRWENREFLQQETDWSGEASNLSHEGLHRLVASITPAVASEITGIPASQIEDAARRFVEHQPGVALAGAGTPANPTEMLTLALVMFLNLLVGAVGKRGTLVDLPIPRFAPVWEDTNAQARRLHDAGKITNTSQLTHALLEQQPTPIDLLFVREANPVFEIPTARLLKQGLSAADRMIVAFATELDETANFADLLLPEPTYLERWDLLSGAPVFPVGHVSLQQPVIAPLFLSRQSEETLARINNSLGEQAYVRFLETKPEKIVEHASRGLFENRRGRVVTAPADAQNAGTPWERLQKSVCWAFDELPDSRSPATTRIATHLGSLLGLSGDLTMEKVRDVLTPRALGAAERYPYELVVFRTQQLRDGGTANLPMMMELSGHRAGIMWATWAEMHPRTAAQEGIEDGDQVRITSELGYIEVTARVSQGTPPGMIAVPLGYGRKFGSTAGGIGANVNLILASGLTEPSWEGHERVTRVTLKRA
jgi:anaerobic selenocysteine-containing dehydrogenase